MNVLKKKLEKTLSHPPSLPLYVPELPGIFLHEEKGCLFLFLSITPARLSALVTNLPRLQKQIKIKKGTNLKFCYLSSSETQGREGGADKAGADNRGGKKVR